MDGIKMTRRIDPRQLLECLKSKLKPNGGILPAKVERMPSLMSRFSDKLVSKCIYVNILMATDEDTLEKFLAQDGQGGWKLIFQWLAQSVSASDYTFTKCLLELLLKCPINVDRLKENSCAKFLKGLSKESEDPQVRELAGKVVDAWLQFIRDDLDSMPSLPVPKRVASTEPLRLKILRHDGENYVAKVGAATIEHVDDDSDYEPDEPPPKKVAVEKPTVKLESPKPSKDKVRDIKRDIDRKHKLKESSESKRKDSSELKRRDSDHKDKHKHSSSNKEKNSSSSSKDKLNTSSSSQKSSSSSRSHSSSQKSQRSDREKSSTSHSKSSSVKQNVPIKKDKEVKSQADKDHDTLLKLKVPAISSLGKIPKKVNAPTTSGSTSVVRPPESPNLPTVKKGSYSDERKRTADLKPGDRPKTVKTLPTKFRSTGLEEEAKPVPSRSEVKKKEEKVELVKRPSPLIKETKESPVPEKKSKMVDIIERKENIPDKPGGIKLIPPKPKPVLIESDIFSDALTASAKLEPRKKKRRPSSSLSKDVKDEVKKEEDERVSPKHDTSPLRETKHTLKFYRDTLEEPEPEPSVIKSETVKEEHKPRAKYYPEGLLVVHRSHRAPKKSIRWKPESELVETRFFELDETERTNVSKTFIDMKTIERNREREGFLMRKHGAMDTMEVKIPWGPLFVIDYPAGKEPQEATLNSVDSSIQFARQKTVLQAIYFSPLMIPDSPAEPDPEVHPTTDPTPIPLEDVTGSVIDSSLTPWPEPKPELVEEVPEPPANTSLPPPNVNIHSMPPGPYPIQAPENWLPTEETTAMPVNGPIPYAPMAPMGPPMYAMGQPPFGPPQGPMMPPGPNMPPVFPGPGGFPPMDPNMFPHRPPMGPMGPHGPGMWPGAPWGGPRGPPALHVKNICHIWKRSGTCIRGNNCRFLHPGENCPPLPC